MLMAMLPGLLGSVSAPGLFDAHVSCQEYAKNLRLSHIDAPEDFLFSAE